MPTPSALVLPAANCVGRLPCYLAMTLFGARAMTSAATSGFDR
jgi:hypothetical protein